MQAEWLGKTMNTYKERRECSDPPSRLSSAQHAQYYTALFILTEVEAVGMVEICVAADYVRMRRASVGQRQLGEQYIEKKVLELFKDTFFRRM